MMIKILALLLLAASFSVSAITATVEQTATIDNPYGGWNYSGLTDRSGDTRVAYDTTHQSWRTT
ncbi:MAG: hypothetical protein HOO95_04915 [Gallionella sp.]|nr:hypothetical protein [Gallionella sp.]